MPDLADGECVQWKGLTGTYQLKNSGGVYSCSCPAWRNQSLGIEKRSCKHLRAFRGAEAEESRTGHAAPAPRRPKAVASARGEAETAGDGPPLLLAHRWEEGLDPTGWWMSEKLDGVRAYWDGRQFLSRLGNVYLAPEWFVRGLPSFPLDGELWVARKAFQRTVSIVRRSDRSDDWKHVSYVVFDAPGERASFEERANLCRAWAEEAKPPHARWHVHVTCEGREHLAAELARVEGLGGEGLMLRKPASCYEVGRSATLLKVKTFHDAEAKVVAHISGAGKHEGRLGALLVEMPDGTQFAVGTGLSDAEREAPPALGAIITYRYQELSDDGVPRFPTYVGARVDVTFKKPTGKPRVEKVAPLPPPVMTTPGRTPSAGPRRRFEFVQGTSSKFWEIEVHGNDLTTRWGRIGSKGQEKTKSFASEAKASAEARKLLESKGAEGYVECSRLSS